MKKSDDRPLTFVTRYCNPIPRIKQTVLEHYKMIRDILSRLFPEAPVFAYRKNDSLRDKLVRACLKAVEEEKVPMPNTPTSSAATDSLHTVTLGNP